MDDILPSHHPYITNIRHHCRPLQNDALRCLVSQLAWVVKMVGSQSVLCRFKYLLLNSEQVVTPVVICHNVCPYFCATAQPMIHELSFLLCTLVSVIIVFVIICL
jgi:hypothetical protein